jgi:hypothetical protein
MCYRCGDGPSYEQWPQGAPAPVLWAGPWSNHGRNNMGPPPKGGLFGMFSGMADRDVQWVSGRRRDRGRPVGGFLDRYRRTIRTTPQ